MVLIRLYLTFMSAFISPYRNWPYQTGRRDRPSRRETRWQMRWSTAVLESEYF